MHQNLAIILQQFNYGKNSFIVLIPGPDKPNSETYVERCHAHSESTFLVLYSHNSLPLGPILFGSPFFEKGFIFTY